MRVFWFDTDEGLTENRVLRRVVVFQQLNQTSLVGRAVIANGGGKFVGRKRGGTLVTNIFGRKGHEQFGAEHGARRNTQLRLKRMQRASKAQRRVLVVHHQFIQVGEQRLQHFRGSILQCVVAACCHAARALADRSQDFMHGSKLRGASDATEFIQAVGGRGIPRTSFGKAIAQIREVRMQFLANNGR